MEKAYRKVDLSELVPYENNPRKNDDAVPDVEESIRQVGYITPIVVDENSIILCGHTRLKALQKAGIRSAEVLIVSGLSDEQKAKYRLLDNKTGEKAKWDMEKLEKELSALDFDGYDFGWDIPAVGEGEEKYSTKAEIPQYEPCEIMPDITDVVDVSKVNVLLEEIDGAEISEPEKEFLRIAAYRHAVINFDQVADYYAGASEEMQRLMEHSALVLIDLDNAIANGFASLSSRMGDIVAGEQNGKA